MSKILKLPNAKPITCACCGCVYEFESGDELILEVADRICGDPIIVYRGLSCPNCRYDNKIYFEKENEQ